MFVNTSTMIKEVEDTLIITATENIDISDDNATEPMIRPIAAVAINNKGHSVRKTTVCLRRLDGSALNLKILFV